MYTFTLISGYIFYHQQLIYVTIYLLNGKVNPYVHAIINLLFAVVASYGIGTLLMKSKMTRF